MWRHNGHRTDTNHGGRRRNRGRVSGGEVVDITAVLIGDGGGVTLPTDPDDLAAVTALLDSLAVKPLTLIQAMRVYQRSDRYQLSGLSGKTLREGAGQR